MMYRIRGRLRLIWDKISNLNGVFVAVKIRI